LRKKEILDDFYIIRWKNVYLVFLITLFENINTFLIDNNHEKFSRKRNLRDKQESSRSNPTYVTFLSNFLVVAGNTVLFSYECSGSFREA
jgi:hypothetical protein